MQPAGRKEVVEAALIAGLCALAVGLAELSVEIVRDCWKRKKRKKGKKR